jgi:hypothetical protein
VGFPKREEAIRVTKERNPNAFKPKILFNGLKVAEETDSQNNGRHTKG